jgi:hypothetical protein
MSSRKRRAAQQNRTLIERGRSNALARKWPDFLCSSSTDEPVSWNAVAELKRLPKNALRLALFMRTVTGLIAVDMPPAAKRFFAGKPLVTEQDQIKAALIAQVSELIENTRVARRNSMLETIPLADERWNSEQLNPALSLWLLGCQCNLLVHYLTENERSSKTGAHFSSAKQVRDLVMYQHVKIMEYPLTSLRMVILRIVKMWTHLPVLDDNFIEYLRLVRLRASELQCMAFERRSRVLDYPQWTKKITATHDRANLDMANQLELYFYHLSKYIEHERLYHEQCVPCPHSVCGPADRDHLYTWLKKRTEEVFLDQWRREVVERAMLVELLPPEREVFRHSNPGANFDTKNVLKYMRSSRHDQINELLLASADKMIEREPVIATVYQMMFLLQADASSFSFDRYVFWVTDVPVDADGCAYPDPAFFKNLDYPVIYCPLSLRSFYVIADGKLYTCNGDIVFAIALWLRIVLGVTRQRPVFEELLAFRFSALRRHLLRGGYDCPIRRHDKKEPSEESKSDSMEDESLPFNDSLARLVQALLTAKRAISGGFEDKVEEARRLSGSPVTSKDPAPTPSMMEF